jgi:hypothetical protein
VTFQTPSNGEDTSVTNTFSESEIELMEDLRYTAMLNKDVDTLNRVLFFGAGRT